MVVINAPYPFLSLKNIAKENKLQPPTTKIVVVCKPTLLLYALQYPRLHLHSGKCNGVSIHIDDEAGILQLSQVHPWVVEVDFSVVLPLCRSVYQTSILQSYHKSIHPASAEDHHRDLVSLRLVETGRAVTKLAEAKKDQNPTTL